MDTTLPDLSTADWLSRPSVGRVFELLKDSNGGARVVGGAVRNALMGVPATGILDFGTGLTPDRVLERAAAMKVRAIPTGLDHGTVTLVVDGEAFEVTTLREDVETDGRHAVVRFGNDWTADALRRDFTINALSVDEAGVVHDPLGGYSDIVAGAVRFIGDPDQRIAEDRLRILRLFRFHAQYGRAELVKADLGAAIRARHGLRELSAERVGSEMRRLAVAGGAGPTVALMQDSGVLPVVLGGIGYVAAFRRLLVFEDAVGAAPCVPLRLAVLCARITEDIVRVTSRLRLTNAERDRMQAALSAAGVFAAPPGRRMARRSLYRHGKQAYRDGVAYGFAWSAAAAGDPAWHDLHALPDDDSVPSFPLSGRDLRGLGFPQGPLIGSTLASLEEWWIDRDFEPDEAELRRRLQAMIAAAQ